MIFSDHKTKIVCTIGPATDSLEQMIKLINAGMNVARLNYSHGDFSQHEHVIKKLREASVICNKSVSILADLPGPKMRIGKIDSDSFILNQNDDFILTTEKIIGNKQRVSISFSKLPEVLKTGDILFLNDGLIQLTVQEILKQDVICKVVVGGELRSYKGLNLPGIDLGILAFTENDHKCLVSALENGADAISQSFVNDAEDIKALRKACDDLGYKPFIVAKIERSGALKNIDEILQYTDGIMIARGDLGVEIPIDQIAVVQKQLINNANILGKPVITATQMMASMVSNPRPTRAEVTDVSNAILDGTDCIMLSEESAMGAYPIEAVSMLSKIAATVEQSRTDTPNRRRNDNFFRKGSSHLTDTISYNVQQSVSNLAVSIVFVHTQSGHTAKMITRFKLPVWIVALTEDVNAFKSLQLSYGIYPVLLKNTPDDWDAFIKDFLLQTYIDNQIAILVEGPSKEKPFSNHKMDIIGIKNL